MANVELKNISKSYDKTRVIEALDLEINDKEFMVFVGPSGCGKSTLLRMIAGLEEITSGELEIDGKYLNDVHPKDRDIAMVFQNYALYPHMSVYENMSFGLKMRNFSKDYIDKKVNEAAKILDLTDYLNRKPKELSGGQRQRVALGRAIVREPKVFLMDEPLSNLDAKLRVHMRTEIKKLHKQLDTTFIYVTHDQIEAMTLGDRITILNKGEIQQIGTPAEIYNKPANVFVASFIGSPATNFIDVKIDNNANLVIEDNTILPSEKMIKIIKENNLEGCEVILGVRPEHFCLVSASKNYDIKKKVSVVEMLGSEKIAYFEVSGSSLSVKLSPDFNEEELALCIDFDKAFLFDKETKSLYS